MITADKNNTENKDSTKNKNRIYSCLWCPCFFFSQVDLERHLLASKVTGVAPNMFDHKLWWKNQLLMRDREFVYNG
jgi:hypothetical protein